MILTEVRLVEEGCGRWSATGRSILEVEISPAGIGFLGGSSTGWDRSHALALSAERIYSFFRKCGWLTKSDMKGIYPAASDANVSKYIIHINKTLSKYLIVGGLRRSHFFGQAGIESNQLVSMSELYNGNDPYEYFRRYANASNYNGWLGNIKYNDGGDFRGRGFKQLTGRANYANYWVYRGWLQGSSFTDNWWKHTAWWGITISGPTVPAAQQATLPIQNAATIAQLDAQFRPPVIVNADRVKNEPFTCIDTAGWFWAKIECWNSLTLTTYLT